MNCLRIVTVLTTFVLISPLAVHADPIPIDSSAVRWTHVLLPPLDNYDPIITALPTTGTVLYDNITTWRRGLLSSVPQSLGYQSPGNDPEIWTSDDLHFAPGQTGFNEVHFVIRTYDSNRPLSLAFWQSDAELAWPDPVMPAMHEFSLTLPEPIPSEAYSTLVTVTLPFTVDLGPHIWMGLQSIMEGTPNEMIAFSSTNPAVGTSEDWWSQLPGTTMQNLFFLYPNNFAYGLSYTAIPEPSVGLPAYLLALMMTVRRHRKVRCN